MCGIAGVVGGAGPDPVLLARMATRMAHRGPDSQGIWYDTTAGLATRRLAIIDLEERSNQPLHLDHWHLAFNGEIYNYRELRNELRSLGHRFVTEGDGEVLLHAWAQWQEAALDRLNGMFAFAVWHDVRRELVCARDPFSEKPLYWASKGDGFAFASSVRALLEARPDLGAPKVEALGPFLGGASCRRTMGASSRVFKLSPPPTFFVCRTAASRSSSTGLRSASRFPLTTRTPSKGSVPSWMSSTTAASLRCTCGHVAKRGC